MLDMEWGQVQEGVAPAEGGVELGGVWGLAEEKDWAFKLSYLIPAPCCVIIIIIIIIETTYEISV